MTDRREFLKVMGSALGCAFLAGCGSSGGGGTASKGVGDAVVSAGGASNGPTALPAAYKITPVVGNGSGLSDGLHVVSNLVNGGASGKASKSGHPFAWYFDVREKYGFTQDQPSKRPAPAQVLGALPGNAWITDDGQLAFMALDSEGGRGIYVGDLDTSSGAAQLKNVRKIVRVGDSLPDGSRVLDFTSGDVSRDLAAVKIRTNVMGHEGYYVWEDGALHPLMTTFQRLPSLFPYGMTSGVLGAGICVDDGGVLVAPALDSARGSGSLGQGLLHMPKGDANKADLLFHKGDLVPGTTSTIQSIMSFQKTTSGEYLAMGTAQPPDQASKEAAAQGQAFNYLLRGSVVASKSGKRAVPRLLAGHAQLSVSKAASGEFVPGSLMQAPRIGDDGTMAYVVNTAPGMSALYIDGVKIVESSVEGKADTSPSGLPVTNLLTPVVGADGTTYCVLGTQKGTELAVFTKGGRRATVARTGDPLAGKTIAAVTMGLTARQANTAGRVVFRVDYTDYSSSLVVGDPI